MFATHDGAKQCRLGRQIAAHPDLVIHASGKKIVALDRRHVWRPYTSSDDHETVDPLVITAAEGVWLTDVNGRRYLDGNGSWWVNTLGHSHPRLQRALTQQAQQLAHWRLVIFVVAEIGVQRNRRRFSSEKHMHPEPAKGLKAHLLYDIRGIAIERYYRKPGKDNYPEHQHKPLEEAHAETHGAVKGLFGFFSYLAEIHHLLCTPLAVSYHWKYFLTASAPLLLGNPSHPSSRSPREGFGVW